MLTHRRRQNSLFEADEAGCTPLHAASMVGQTEVLRVLLRAGADPNVQDVYALAWACVCVCVCGASEIR